VITALDRHESRGQCWTTEIGLGEVHTRHELIAECRGGHVDIGVTADKP
jgi:hypothetical protein